MKLDSANRNFYGLIGLVAVPYLLIGMFGCGLIGYVGYQVLTDGASALTADGHDLRPALAFFTVVGGGTVAALWSVARQHRATRALDVHVAGARSQVPTAVAVAAEQARLTGRVDVVADDDPFCFTYGLLHPRVVVTTGLVERMSAEELGAVLTHERYHVTSRDPLKVVVARALSWAFFFLPAVRWLHRRYLAGRELAADRRAVDEWGRPPLVGALAKAVAGPHWGDLGGAAAIAGDEHLELRVIQLEQGREPALPPVPRRAVGVSGCALLGLLVALILAVVAAGGPGEFMGMDNSRMSSSSGMWGVSGGLAMVGMALCMGGWLLGAWYVVRRFRRSHRTRL